MRIPWKGKLNTIFDAYPTYASIFQEKRAQQNEIPRDIYSKYRGELTKSQILGSALAAGRTYLNYADMLSDDIRLWLNSTDMLAKDLFLAEKPPQT